MKSSFLVVSLVGLVFGLASGACGSKPSFTVGGNTLSVQDSGYYTADYFCEGAGQGQIKIDLVDYKPICGTGASTDGFSEPQNEHNDLEMIVVYDPTALYNHPYPVSMPNCSTGPAGPGIAYFSNYPSGSATPMTTIAQGGNIYVYSFDTTGKKPMTGSFTLDFGSAGTINGDFTTYTCQ